LGEIRSKLYDMYGLNCGLSTLCRTLKFMGYSRQVIKKIDIRCIDELRAEFMAEISMHAGADPEFGKGGALC